MHLSQQMKIYVLTIRLIQEASLLKCYFCTVCRPPSCQLSVHLLTYFYFSFVCKNKWLEFENTN